MQLTCESECLPLCDERHVCAAVWKVLIYLFIYLFSTSCLCLDVHARASLLGDGTLDREVIDSENLQINSWTAGAKEIRSEAQAAHSVVRQAPEQTVISGL